jgi:hypothetical protein
MENSVMKKLFQMATLMVLSVGIGCSQQDDQPSQARNNGNENAGASAGDGAGHSHGDAPHGGTIADWGGGAYHVEFTVDHDAESATVYILGDDVQTAAPVDAQKLLLTIKEPAFQVELTPDPLPGEAQGTSSRFVGEHENLGIVREFAGTISGEVDGTPYAGDFEEQPHGHSP